MATIEELNKKLASLNSEFTSSPTAYGQGVTSTGSDLSLEKQILATNNQIDKLKSQQIRNQWYGREDGKADDTNANNQGWFMKGITALQKPLNATMGAIQYALGKGQQNTLTGNVNAALKSGLTAGNILKQYDVPRGIQVPLGFILDVALDPVNWLTAGTSALVPRVGTGVVKGFAKKAAVEGVEGVAESGITGALKGAATGFKSGIQGDFTKVANMVPFVRRIAKAAPKVVEKAGVKEAPVTARNLGIYVAQKYRNFVDKVGKSAIKNSEAYDRLIGSDVYSRMNKTLVGGFNSGALGDMLENALNDIPSKKILGMNTPSGEKIVDFFKYSPKTAAETTDLKDKIYQLAKNKNVLLTRSKESANFEFIDDFLSPNAKISLTDKTKEVMDTAIRDADGVLKSDYVNNLKLLDTKANAKALLEAAGEDYNIKHLNEAYKTVAKGKTGFQWYDDVVDKLKNTTVDDIFHGRLGALSSTDEAVKLVEKEADDIVKAWNSYGKVKDLKPFKRILDAYPTYISIFKSAKVPMNAASHVVAQLGNFFMGAMMGLPVYKIEYLRSLTKANKLLRGKLGAAGLKKMFLADVNNLADMMLNHPNRFRQFTGIEPSEIIDKIDMMKKTLGGVDKTSSVDDIAKFVSDAFDRIEQGVADMDRIIDLEKTNPKAVSEVFRKPYKTGSQTVDDLMKNGKMLQSDMPGSWAAGELQPNDKIDKVKAWIGNEAKKGNPAAFIADKIVNSMPRWYEQIDQTWKIGTTDFLTQHGVNEEALKIMSRTVNIGKEDLLSPTILNGEKLYKLKPLKASEVAMEAYMNYAAMPDFVKMMRAIPIAGSSFFSFPYAMAIKTGKTVMDNPAIFNKVAFGINEMNADRSPAEKKALDEKYNTYLKSPSVVKIFGMWNTDIKNFVPYFTMNMLNPSERDLKSVNGKIFEMTDKIPVFQDPIGQVIKDYFIQPWILSGSGETPQGQFGQPLFKNYDINGNPIETDLVDRGLYAARSAAESLIPGVAGYAGLVNMAGVMSPEAVEFIPSYNARVIANATQGRSSIGATTKEDAVRKTLRAVLGRTGLPAYTLDTTNTLSD